MAVLGLETILKGVEPTFFTHIQFIYTVACFVHCLQNYAS